MEKEYVIYVVDSSQYYWEKGKLTPERSLAKKYSWFDIRRFFVRTQLQKTYIEVKFVKLVSVTGSIDIMGAIKRK